MEHKEESEVVAHAQYDPEAFGRLYDIYYQPIFGFLLRRTGNVETAKDLTSETFFHALKNIRRYKPRPGKPFVCWLFAIAVAQMGNYYRHRVQIFPLLLESSPEIAAEESYRPDVAYQQTEDQEEENQQMQKLRYHITKLNQKQQNILGLRYFSKLSLAEIAQTMNMKESTVKSHIHRAVKKLYVLMTEIESLDEEKKHPTSHFYAIPTSSKS